MSDTVIIDGNIVMKNEQIQTLNEVEIIEMAQEAFEDLLNVGGYTLSLHNNPKPSFKTNLIVKLFQTFLKLSQKLKGV